MVIRDVWQQPQGTKMGVVASVGQKCGAGRDVGQGTGHSLVARYPVLKSK